jgi:hypothetical protein
MSKAKPFAHAGDLHRVRQLQRDGIDAVKERDRTPSALLARKAATLLVMPCALLSSYSAPPPSACCR